MFAIRSIITNPLRRSSNNSEILSSAAWRGSHFFSTASDEFQTGSIKFYIREKAYGFIIPDDIKAAGSADIWVHRTSFETPHSIEEHPTRPYLYQGERVKFRVKKVKGPTPQAMDLTFANGEIVPLFRRNYAESVIKGVHQRIGDYLIETIQNEEGLTGNEQMEKLKTAVTSAEETIATAERNQQLYGYPTYNKEEKEEKEEQKEEEENEQEEEKVEEEEKMEEKVQ